MGMMFTYTLGQCNDWETCRLEKGDSVARISEKDPAHWHLTQHEGGGWIFKTRDQCMMKLLLHVGDNYDRLYDEQGNYRG